MSSGKIVTGVYYHLIKVVQRQKMPVSLASPASVRPFGRPGSVVGAIAVPDVDISIAGRYTFPQVDEDFTGRPVYSLLMSRITLFTPKLYMTVHRQLQQTIQGESRMNGYLKHTSRILVVSLTLGLAGCAMETKQQKGTAVGAGVGAGLGAIVGQAIGKSTEATLLGAGIGAALGGVAGNQIGKYMDQQEQDLRYAIGASESASISREQDVLTATFRSEAFFDNDSSNLKPGAYNEIDRVAGVLNKYPSTRIQVAGHTDSRGSEQYNLDLSQRRADSVKNALVQRGVDPMRIQTIGYGESQPVSSSDAMNRRVEIVIVPIQA
jgi:outer membrane protein OmpA-like peptidoglycan-associated protein